MKIIPSHVILLLHIANHLEEVVQSPIYSSIVSL
nr:MAG TPA: hypothetical protein [Caudoviricetes sp.]